MNRPLNLVIPEADAELLDQLAERLRRRPRDQAEALLIAALRQAGNGLEARILALADEFDAEGDRLFAAAESPSAGPRRRLLLQTRAETWFRAAMRLRAAMALPHEARSALPGDRPTAA